MLEKKIPLKKQTFKNFRNRKFIHYTLLLSLISLALLLLILLYNKFYNEPKLDQFKKDLHTSEQVNHFSTITKQSYLNAQSNLQNYIFTRDEQYLVEYNKALAELNKNLNNLHNAAGSSDLLSLYLRKVDIKNFSVASISSKIDSITKLKAPDEIPLNDYLLKTKSFEYSSIIDSLSYVKNTVVDSIQKKGLFARVGDAIKGNVEVQREKENITLTLGKKNIEANEHIKKQFDNLFKTINEHYQKEFRNYKKHYAKQFDLKNNNDNDFLNSNKDLLFYSNQLIEKYNSVFIDFERETRKNFEEKYQNSKYLNNVIVFALLFIIVLIIVLLIYFTKLTFEYERRLEISKDVINQNLNFKNRIVGMISHEIRAPLNIISIYSKGIRKQVEDENINESLKAIEFTTNSLALLANQILEFSKNENKQLELNSRKFDLNNELTGIFNSLRSVVEDFGNKLNITSKLDDNLTNVFSDPIKIHQLFYNLVGNSNKFTSNGNISIQIDSTLKDSKYVNLKVIITDNGNGITGDDLKNIFKEYHQGTISQNVSNMGVGLGLNLCREIIELYNGKIDVKSKYGVETIVSFNLLLPLSDY